MASKLRTVSLVAGVLCLAGSAWGQPDVDYNRRIRVQDVKIVSGVNSSGTPQMRLLGSTQYWGAPVGSLPPRDISGVVLVEVGGVALTDPGSTGSCPSNLITYGTGTPFPVGPGSTWFNCMQFCTGCSGSDVNVCVPSSPSPDPLCMCIQQCLSRLVGGGGGGGAGGGVDGELSLVAVWSFDLPAATPPNAPVVVRVNPLGNGLPEIDTSDDQFSASVGQLMACGRADLGRQGGLRGHDGNLDNNDFVAFIDSFFDGDVAADLGRQGGLPGRDDALDNNDFIAFIDLFFRGC